MSNFVAPKVGGWVDGETITGFQISQLQALLLKAPNGDDGSSHAPATPWTIAGAGIAVSGPTVLTGAATATSLTLQGAAKVGYVSRSLVRIQPFVGQWTNDTGRWQAQLNAANSWITTGSVSAVSFLYIPIDAPHGATISQVRVRYIGAGAHAGLPGVMPSIQLTYWDASTDAEVLVPSAGFDGSISTGAFQAQHWIAAAGLGHVVDRTQRFYRVRVTGESGANALVGAVASQCEVTAAFTSQSEWM